MKTITFEAEIREGRRGGAWVEIPFDVSDEYGTRGRVKVKAKLDDIEYRGSLAPVGGGVHVLGIRKDVREAAGMSIGDIILIELERDTEPRTVDIPRELADLLSKQKRLKARFDKMAFTHRKEFCHWVGSAKRSDTRKRRAEKAIAMLREGETLS